MPLFDSPENPAPAGYNQRSGLIRESGTRRLVIGGILLIAAYFIYAKVNDTILLQKQWQPLQPDTAGLTIVGTLDSRTDYESNLFRIVTANKTTRVELTDFGKRSIFTDTDGEMSSSGIFDTIAYARKIDSETGFAMLEPYLRLGVAKILKQSGAQPTEQTPIVVSQEIKDRYKEQSEELGVWVNKFREDAIEDKRLKGDDDDGESGGSGTSREVEHGLAIPGINVARSCPVVLTSQHFTSADMETHPKNMLQDETYTLHLNLTPEGRSRFYQWSRNHVNENLVFVLNGETLMSGRVSQAMNVSDWTIGPVFNKDSAQKLMDFINK
jgi:preprotein translocase subunit SecD